MSALSKSLSTLPILRSVKGNAPTSARIVEILAAEGDTTIARLHALLYERFHLRISYQGVRKVTHGLRDEGMLCEKDGVFIIDRGWLLSAREAIDRLLSAGSAPGSRELAIARDFQCYECDSLFSLDTLWGNLLLDICGRFEVPQQFLSLNHHAFWMPLNAGREQEIFSDLLEDGWRVTFLFAKHSRLNDWAIKIYGAMGVSTAVKNLSAIPESTYYNVIGDMVIEAVLDNKLMTLVRKAGGSGKNVSPEDLRRLSRSRGSCQLRVFANKVLADSLLRLNQS